MALQSSNYTNGRIVGQPTEGVITEIREAFSKYCAYDKLCIGSLAILNKKKLILKACTVGNYSVVAEFERYFQRMKMLNSATEIFSELGWIGKIL